MMPPLRAVSRLVAALVTAPCGKANSVRLRAQYTRDVKRGLQRFVWASVEDPRTSPPKLIRAEANIGPG